MNSVSLKGNKKEINIYNMLYMLLIKIKTKLMKEEVEV